MRKTTSDFIMCVCVYSKYIHLQNESKTNDFRYQITRLFVRLWRGMCVKIIIFLPRQNYFCLGIIRFLPRHNSIFA